MKRLKEKIETLDKKPYGFYKQLKGVYSYVDFSVGIEHVQGDPFAIPSNVTVSIPIAGSGYPREWLTEKNNQIPLGDFITRRFFAAFREIPSEDLTGNGGRFFISRPGQQILSRSSVRFFKENIEIRIRMGLPAHFRKIASEYTEKMFFKYLPDVVTENGFMHDSFKDDLQAHIEIFNNQIQLQAQLDGNQLIGFVPNGANLPRESGVSDLPLDKKEATLFKSPAELEVSLDLSDGSKIVGMGIKKGINLIVGGGFHGKSTLLEALVYGIYPHIKGDGREFVCMDDSAVNIRAENGRVVNNVNIDSYISGLPNNKSTLDFSTENASGSTSQAASIVESVNSGSRVLLMDEDNCATNFMFRDEKMKSLISEKDEPIKTFIHSVEKLYQEQGVSTLLVMGAIGEYFHYATDVIGLNNYQVSLLTKAAKEIVSAENLSPEPTSENNFKAEERSFVPDYHSFGEGKAKVKVRVFSNIDIGDVSINISGLEQLVSEDQVRMLGYLVKELMKKENPLSKAYLQGFLRDKNQEEFAMIKPYRGDLAEIRLVDLMGVLNRFPGMKVIK